MSSENIFNLNDVNDENEKYLINIHFTDADGKEFSFNATGKTLEELYTDIFTNGITTILDSNISENNIDENESCLSNNDCAHYKEDLINTDEMLLNYTIMLEEENEQLRDEIHFLRNRLEKADKIIEKVPAVIKITNESITACKEFQLENDDLYAYIASLENDIKKLEKTVNQKDNQEKEISELRESIATLQELVSQISFITKNKKFVNPKPFTIPSESITPNDWPQRYKVWM